MEKRAMIGAVLAIIAVILIGVTLALPWYTYTSKGNGSADYYFDHAVISTNATKMTIKYSDMEKYAPNTIGVFKNTQILDIVSLVLVIIGFIGALLLAVGKLGKGVAVSLVAIGFILSLIAPLYFYAALPGAVKADSGLEQSFFGSKNGMSYGGGIGWWLAIVGMILILIALILVAVAKKPQPETPSTGEEEIPPAPPVEPAEGETEQPENKEFSLP